jgi:hypothetical protein
MERSKFMTRISQGPRDKLVEITQLLQRVRSKAIVLFPDIGSEYIGLHGALDIDFSIVAHQRQVRRRPHVTTVSILSIVAGNSGGSRI